MGCAKKLVTADGYDMQFGTNAIGTFSSFNFNLPLSYSPGHYYFTIQLLPALLAAAQSPSNPDKKARVVTVTSFSHYMSPKFDFDAIKDGPKRKKYGAMDLYGLSKLVWRYRFTSQGKF